MKSARGKLSMRKRHAKLAQAILEKAAAALGAIPEEDIRVGDLCRMVDVAAKLERLSRGDAEEPERAGTEQSPVRIYIPDNHRDRDELEDIAL